MSILLTYVVNCESRTISCVLLIKRTPITMAKYPCIDCKKEVGNSYSLQCSICARWQHKACGIPECVFKLATEMKDQVGTHIWTCDGCGAGLSNIHKIIQVQNNKIQGIQTDVANVKQQATDNKLSISTVKEEVKEVMDRLEKIEETAPERSGQDAIDEINAREAKKNNVIIHGIAEPEDEDNVEKKKKDEEFIQKLFKSLDKSFSDTKKIKFVTRLGEKRTNNRPILVGLRRQDDKEQILGSCWKLANSEYEDISIAPDLTKKQRANDSTQRKEQIKRNSELSDEDKAKNLEWKLVGLPGQKRLVKTEKKKKTQAQTSASYMARHRINSQKRKASDSQVEEEEMDMNTEETSNEDRRPPPRQKRR